MLTKSFYSVSLRLANICFMAASNPCFLAVRRYSFAGEELLRGEALRGENLEISRAGDFAAVRLSPIFLRLEFGVEN